MTLFFSLILGVFVSFLGQLPVGTLSLTATQIAVQENFRNAWRYAFGVALIEMIYLRGVFSGLQWIRQHQQLLTLFNWGTVIFFLVLGILSFIAASDSDKEKKALLLNNRIDRFLLGVSMSALNPLQIPFWLLWTGYLLNLGWLSPVASSFNLFTIGSGMGTLGGLFVYMYAGNWVVTTLKTSNQRLNKIMGIVFIIAAGAQAYHTMGH